ncbi:unnamed protein product [Gongylonema pulchrum]|uniref:RanGAP1_C domain-containing protein n=1 Tax=Gongylonema pulchrum TaxID=637853 RepID=A0A183E871_9BILA|nr:unnamed protein product [Gongylonema pulchrum]
MKSFPIKQLILHTNNLGSAFGAIKSRWSEYDYIDLGSESGDEGSIDDVEAEDELAERFSDGHPSGDAGCESDDEYNGNYGDTDTGAKEIFTTLMSMKCLKVLNLSGNYIGLDAYRKIAEALVSRSKQKVLPELRLLEVLDLGSCDCSERGILKIVASLNSSQHLHLKKLNFSSNGLGANAVTSITLHFASGFHLEKLSFHANNLGSRYLDLKDTLSEFGFVDLGNRRNIRSYAKCVTKSLVLFNEYHIAALSVRNVGDIVLPELRLLEVLDLGWCDCSERGILKIVASLNSSQHLHLKKLNFSSNGLGANAVTSVTLHFASGFHLEKLSFHANNLGSRYLDLKDTLSEFGFVDLGNRR